MANRFKLLSGAIVTALITISNAKAGNMTADELVAGFWMTRHP